MRVQPRKPAKWVAVALCLCGIAAAPTRAQETRATLSVSAGLGGFVKAGRWAPVRVEIDNPGGLSSADLEVRWGDATVRREIVFGSPGVRRFELLVRTAEAGSVMRIALRSPGGEEVVTEQPVTVLSQSTPMTLCVTALGEWPDDAARCTVTLVPQQLPASVRAYEIVDEVLTTGDSRSMSEVRRVALDRWRSLHALEASGDLSLTPQVTRPVLRRGLASASAPVVTGFAGGYIALLLLIGLAGATARVSPSWVWLAVVLWTIAAAAAALALGRVGPGAKVIVHHTSLLQQIAGASGSLLTLRGVAEFPSDDAVHLRVPLADGTLETASAAGPAAQATDDAGYPTLNGRFGLGTRQAFSAEAVTDTQWLTVIERGEMVEISNRSDETLHDCRFGDGMSVTDVGHLPPDQKVTARRQGEVAGPLFTCTAAVPALALAERSHVVEMRGTTTVAVYRDRRFGATASEVPDD